MIMKKDISRMMVSTAFVHEKRKHPKTIIMHRLSNRQDLRCSALSPDGALTYQFGNQRKAEKIHYVISAVVYLSS